MALDGIVTSSIVEELQSCIGARIYKIHQPNQHDLVFNIRGQGTQRKLILSANPTYPRIHWTTATFINPLEAPMFCMLMRKYCEGGIIERIEQVNRERIIHIDVRHRDEIGDTSFKRIIIEIMGRHSNIILVDPSSNIIHDGIHHVTPALSSYRIIMPGSQYIAPPEQHKVDPLIIDTEEKFFNALLAKDESLAQSFSITPKQLVQAFSGFSPLLAEEIVYRSITSEYEHALPSEQRPLSLSGASVTFDLKQLWLSFNHFRQALIAKQFKPNIVSVTATDKQYFSVTPLTQLDGAQRSFDSISACLEAFYGNKAERDTVKQRASDLIRFVQNEKQKNESKLTKLNSTLEEAKDADQYRVIGELLTTYMHQMKRGDTEIEVANYYDKNQAMITISLDPQLAPSENAQRFFKRYTKQKNSQIVVLEQLEITKGEISYFNAILQQLEVASLSDIDEIREELVSQGYLREKVRRGPKKKKGAKPSILCYTSSEGIDIYVGKNNIQNEYVTNRLGSASDTWLHTKDIPGSHVLIRSANFNEATLQEAAMLAAYYSQARSSSSVPVDYTLIRHVKKPNGAKPGFVIYDNQKTLYVTPQEDLIKELVSVTK